MASVAAWFATIVRLSVDKGNMMRSLAVIAKPGNFWCNNVDMRNI
jgi:hypothetical protein